MAELFEILNKRSSTRGYSDEKLTDAEIQTLMEAGLKAPTAANRQELHFTSLERTNPVMTEIGSGLNPANPLAFLYGAPTLFIISGREDFGWSALDAGIAVENMHLAATDMGLGSVIIGCIKDVMTGAKKAELNKALGIPEGYEYYVALAVGHATTGKEQHTNDYENNVNIIR